MSASSELTVAAPSATAQFILPAAANAPAASNHGVAGSGTPICSTNTAANKTAAPCRTRNSSV